MLQRLVAQWLKQQAADTLKQSLRPDPDSVEEATSPECDLVCVFPSAAEAGGFVDKLAGTKTTKCKGFTERRGLLGNTVVTVVEAPVAQELLARIVQEVIRLHKPTWVVSSGFCVALKGNVQRGGMVMARQIVDVSGYSLRTGLQVDAQGLSKGVYLDTLLTMTESTTDEPPSGALAVDQQAAIVAEVCRLQRIKMFSVHAVAGARGDRSATVVTQMQKQSSLVAKLGAATGALLDQPSSFKHLLNDKEKTLRQSDRLATFLVGVIDSIAEK